MSESPFARLPIYETSLIGRDTECAEVKHLVLTTPSRFVTLIGESGAGKTRLALEVAGDLAQAFTDGITVIPLDAVHHSAFVLQSIAAALNIQESAHQPLSSTLANALKTQSMLLILDNLEQVRESVGDLIRLIEQTDHLRILATSQVQLGDPRETVYVLPPLAIPPMHLPLNPALFLQYPAIALFVSRLQAVQPHFVLTQTNASIVRRICQLLNGFPLAIELVAAHSAVLSPADLLLLLRNHLGVPSTKTHISSRTAILRPVLDWCISRLPEHARHLIETLGVFSGGWELEAAARILSPDLEPAEIEAALDILVQKHLIRKESLAGHPVRYGVLDAIQAYSTQRLTRHQAQTTFYERHLHYYFDLARTMIQQAKYGPTAGTTIKRLQREQHNLRAALDWAYQSNHTMCSRIVALMGWFWRSQGHISEAHYWTTRTLTLGDLAPEFQGPLYYELGAIAMLQDANEQALKYLNKAHAFFQHYPNRIGMAETLNMQGNVYSHMEAYPIAMVCYEQAMAVWDTLEPDLAPPPLAKINAYNNIGCIHLMLAQWEQALEALEKAHGLAIPHNHRIGIANATINRGWAVYGRGERVQAFDYFIEALDMFHELDDRYGIAETLEGLAGIYGDSGHAYDAALLLGTAAAIREQIGIPLMKVDHIRYYDAILQTVQGQLSADAFQEAWQTGNVTEWIDCIARLAPPKGALDTLVPAS